MAQITRGPRFRWRGQGRKREESVWKALLFLFCFLCYKELELRCLEILVKLAEPDSRVTVNPAVHPARKPQQSAGLCVCVQAGDVRRTFSFFISVLLVAMWSLSQWDLLRERKGLVSLCLFCGLCVFFFSLSPSTGLWLYPAGKSMPCLTLIGSPNFGYRSVHRDLETQIALVTENQDLQRQLHQVTSSGGELRECEC